MNILLNTHGDPTWQVLALVITLAAPVLIVAVHTRDVYISEQQKRRDTLTMLWVWLATFLLVRGWRSRCICSTLHRRGRAALHHHPYQRRRLHLHRRPHRHPS
jgi:hypothetical protein